MGCWFCLPLENFPRGTLKGISYNLPPEPGHLKVTGKAVNNYASTETRTDPGQRGHAVTLAWDQAHRTQSHLGIAGREGDNPAPSLTGQARGLLGSNSLQQKSQSTQAGFNDTQTGPEGRGGSTQCWLHPTSCDPGSMALKSQWN